LEAVSIIVQRDATLCSLFYLLQGYSTCSGHRPHPPTEVHKTVTSNLRYRSY